MKMKQILGLLLVSVLLWSCGSQFSRSKYNRYMWNRSGGKTEKELISASEESKTNHGKMTEEVKAGISLIDQTETGSIEAKKSSEADVQSNEINTETRAKITTESNELKEDRITKNRITKNQKSSLKKSRNNPMQDGDVDAMWIVTLILCFLIPPLGVFLKDGGITGLFWLVLILCLLGGSILFGLAGYFGGLYGVGIILALLRFFDII